MELTRDEEKALDGDCGEALATAYRILVAIGEAIGAKKLVPVKWAHISGVNYNTIGDGGIRFLEKFTRRCIVFCSRTIYNTAVKIGLAGRIEKSGADFRCDSCTCPTPYVTKDRYNAVITNSVKGAYYLSKSNKVKVELKDIKTITEEYTQ